MLNRLIRVAMLSQLIPTSLDHSTHRQILLMGTVDSTLLVTTMQQRVRVKVSCLLTDPNDIHQQLLLQRSDQRLMLVVDRNQFVSFSRAGRIDQARSSNVDLVGQ